MKKLHLVIADDDRWFRKGICDELRIYPIHLTEIDNTGPLFEALKQQPDIVMLELKMSGRNGENILADLKMLSPHTRVIVMGDYYNAGLVSNCLKRGASWYLPKRSIESGQMLYDTICNVHGRNTHNIYATQDNTRYTNVEIEFIHMSHEGKTIKEIATAAGITEKAAERRRQRLYSKTNSRSKADFIRNIICNGLEYLAKA